MQQTQQPSVKDLIKYYLEMAWRRKLCVLPFPFICGLAFYYAMSLPPVYESTGVILVENQNPSSLIATTVTSHAAQELQVIRQKIETTENLVNIIDKFDLYSGATNSDKSFLAAQFRSNMDVNTISADFGDSGRNRGQLLSIAFQVSFKDHSPETAQLVASELINLFVTENSASRTKDAEQAASFLRKEADLLQKRVISLEDDIAYFKNENADSLPSLLEYNLGVVTSSEERIRENQLAIDNLSEQEQLLSIELRSLDPYTDTSQLTPAALLSLKRSELTQLRIKYSESHPTLLALQREIANLEKEVNSDQTSETAVPDESLLSPDYLQLKYRIGSIARDIASMADENTNLKTQIVEYNKRIENTYLVERELDELQRDYDASFERYEELRSAQYEAEVAKSLELESRAESLQVIEIPNIPRYAVGPDRLKIVALGIGFAGAVCVGLALLLEFLDERVRGQRGFENLIGEEAIVIVPKLRTIEDLAARSARYKKIIVTSILACILLLVVGLTLTHLFIVDLSGFWLDTIE